MTAFTFNASNQIITSANAIASYSNGLPFDSSGALVVNDDTIAPSIISGGIPFDGAGAVAVDSVSAASTIQNGIPFTADGRVSVDSFNAVNNFQNGLPLTTSKLSVESGGLWYGDSLALNNVLPSYVSQFDKNRYYNSAAGVIPFPYTYSRGGNATMFDSQGRLVWADANMLTYSDDLTNAIWTKNDTTISSAGETAPSGAAASLATEGTAGTALLQQQLTGLAINNPYAYTFEIKRGNTDWVRAFVGAGGNDVRAWFNLATGALGTNSASGAATIPKAAQIVDLGGGWYRCTVFAANIGATGPVFLTVSAVSDNSNTRVSNATRILGRQKVELYAPDSPKLPMVQTTATAYYAPRTQDYDPSTLEELGILSEPAHTNAVTTSDAITAGNVSVTTGANYLGGWTFQRVTADGTSALHSAASTSLTPSATQTRRVGAVVKSISGSGLIQLAASINHSAADVYANFDLSSGTVVGSGAGALNARCRPLGNGLYKIGFTYVTTAVPGSGALAVLYFITAAGDTRAPTNTSTDVIDVNFFNGAANDMEMSILPTFGTAATRPDDNIDEVIGAWLDATKGTIYIDFMSQFVAVGSGTQNTFLQFSDGTGNNRLTFTSGVGTNSQHRFDTLVGGVTQAQVQSTILGTALTRRKMIGAYATDSFRACENGGTVASDVLGTVPTGLNRLDVGALLGAQQMNGWTREIRYYPDNSASDAQLQTITG